MDINSEDDSLYATAIASDFLFSVATFNFFLLLQFGLSLIFELSFGKGRTIFVMGPYP